MQKTFFSMSLTRFFSDSNYIQCEIHGHKMEQDIRTSFCNLSISLLKASIFPALSSAPCELPSFSCALANSVFKASNSYPFHSGWKPKICESLTAFRPAAFCLASASSESLDLRFNSAAVSFAVVSCDSSFCLFSSFKTCSIFWSRAGSACGSTCAWWADTCRSIEVYHVKYLTLKCFTYFQSFGQLIL